MLSQLNRFLLRWVWRAIVTAFCFTLANRWLLHGSLSNSLVLGAAFASTLFNLLYDIWINRQAAAGKDPVPPLLAVVVCIGILSWYWYDALTAPDGPVGYEWLLLIGLSMPPLLVIIGAGGLLIKRWRERDKIPDKTP